MKLQLRLQDEATRVRQQFERAGWHVDAAEDDRLCVSHAQIASQTDARRRLDAMGLLTSNRVQIEFCAAALSPLDSRGG